MLIHYQLSLCLVFFVCSFIPNSGPIGLLPVIFMIPLVLENLAQLWLHHKFFFEGPISKTTNKFFKRDWSLLTCFGRLTSYFISTYHFYIIKLYFLKEIMLFTYLTLFAYIWMWVPWEQRLHEFCSLQYTWKLQQCLVQRHTKFKIIEWIRV